MANTPVDGDKLQKLTTSVAVIESETKSLREFLEKRLDSMDKGDARIALILEDHNKRIYQNEKNIASVTTWMTLIGTIIGIAVALSYLL